MLRWYLIHTKPYGESLATRNLERQEYRTYLPRVLQAFRRAGRQHERVVPLFPRYLFLQLDEGRQALGPVASTLGVSGIVRFGSEYTIVPDRIVRDLQSRAHPESGLHRLNCGARLSPGAPVRMVLGPFSGLDGVFERAAGAERVIVLLSFLGHSAPVCVPSESIMLSRAL